MSSGIGVICEKEMHLNGVSVGEQGRGALRLCVVGLQLPKHPSFSSKPQTQQASPDDLVLVCWFPGKSCSAEKPELVGKVDP